jgi:hypothetical protein
MNSPSYFQIFKQVRLSSIDKANNITPLLVFSDGSVFNTEDRMESNKGHYEIYCVPVTQHVQQRWQSMLCGRNAVQFADALIILIPCLSVNAIKYLNLNVD